MRRMTLTLTGLRLALTACGISLIAETSLAVPSPEDFEALTAALPEIRAGHKPELVARADATLLERWQRRTRVENVSRVVYDVSSKPPATIEWE